MYLLFCLVKCSGNKAHKTNILLTKKSLNFDWLIGHIANNFIFCQLK